MIRSVLSVFLICGFSSYTLANGPAKNSTQLNIELFPETLQKSAYFEQKLIGIRNIEKDTLDPQYQPENGKVFEVPTYWVDRDLYEVRIDEKSIPEEIKKIIFRRHKGKDQILISVHPDGMDYYPEILSQAQKGKPFTSTASASPRSLITVAEDKGVRIGFYNKLSLNKKLGGNIRLIHKVELARSYFLTQLLSQEKNLPADFGFYSEFLVMLPKGADTGGTILRSIPSEVQSGQVIHIPFFALYAPQPDGSKPLILKMAEKAGLSVDEYFHERLAKPFLRQWMKLAFEHGISMEPHGQNLLLEVTPEGNPTGRFIHRDFGGFTVDLEYRKSLGLATPELPELNNYRVNYDAGDVSYGLNTSLDLYFGSIRGNLAARYQDWFAKGWVKKPMSEHEFYMKQVQMIEEAFKDYTGRKLNLKGRMNNLYDPILKARQYPKVKRCMNYF